MDIRELVLQLRKSPSQRALCSVRASGSGGALEVRASARMLRNSLHRQSRLVA